MTELVILIALVLFPVLFLVLLARNLWRVMRPITLLRAGRYAEAASASKLLERTWMGRFPQVRNAARYSAALAFHLLGDLEGSQATLKQIRLESLDRNLRYAVQLLDGSNLVLAERDFASAVRALDDAAAIHQPVEDLLLLAHARLGLGDSAGAQDLLTRAGATRGAARIRLGKTVLVEDNLLQDAIFHSMRGQLLRKLGRPDEATRDLELAAAVPLENIYTTRARSLLSPRA